MFALNILNAMKSNFGKNMISIIIGIGIASLFRKSCEGKECMIFKGPEFEKITNTVYKYNDKCYKFIEKNVTCNKFKKQIDFA